MRLAQEISKAEAKERRQVKIEEANQRRKEENDEIQLAIEASRVEL